MYKQITIRNNQSVKNLSLESLLIMNIVLISLFGAGLVALVYYFAKPWMLKLKYNIRTERIARGKEQKKIEKKFEKEFRENFLEIINENPAIAEAFPETIELGELYKQEGFVGMKILSELFLPVIRTMSGAIIPQNEQQAQLQKGVQVATDPSIINFVQAFLPALLNRQNSPNKPKIKPPARQSKIENV